MSILDKLKKDHDKVREILKKIQKLLDQYPQIDEKKEKFLAAELMRKLEPHNKAEEKVFYGALQRRKKDSLNPYEGKEEHHVAFQVLKTLQKTNLKKSQRTAKTKVLKELLLHHIEEEESHYFKEAKEYFTTEELQILGEKFTEEKKKIIKLL